MSLPSTIHAIGLTGKGDFDVIKKLELPFPTPAADQILTKVRPIRMIETIRGTHAYVISRLGPLCWYQLH